MIDLKNKIPVKFEEICFKKYSISIKNNKVLFLHTHTSSREILRKIYVISWFNDRHSYFKEGFYPGEFYEWVFMEFHESKI